MKLKTVKQRYSVQEVSLLGANLVHGLTRCLLIASLLMGVAAQADERLTSGVTTAKDGVQIHYETGAVVHQRLSSFMAGTAIAATGRRSCPCSHRRIKSWLLILPGTATPG